MTNGSHLNTGTQLLTINKCTITNNNKRPNSFGKMDTRGTAFPQVANTAEQGLQKFGVRSY